MLHVKLVSAGGGLSPAMPGHERNCRKQHMDIRFHPNIVGSPHVTVKGDAPGDIYFYNDNLLIFCYPLK